MTNLTHSFRNRFQAVQRKRQGAELLSGIALLLLGLTLVVALVAALDYRWELDQSVRLSAVLLGAAAMLILIGGRIARALHRCGETATASDVEQQHPEFGQRVRTTVQYVAYSRDDLRREGVEPQLVAALSEETEVNVLPGEMEEVVPVRRTWGVVAAAAAAVLLLVGSTVDRWEWSRAVRRALLSDRPYTSVTVAPGNATVEEGVSLPVSFTVAGRPRQELRLLSRPAASADAAWAEEILDPASAEQPSEREWRYAARISRIVEPMEYRVIVGPEETDVYKIGVRYPLEIRNVSAELQPPDYTGLKPRQVPDGNLTGLRGTAAKVTVELDRTPLSAEVTLTRVGVLPQDVERTTTQPVVLDGNRVKFQLELEHDLTWSLSARSSDDTWLPENAFRIRVQQDQSPKVTFQEPDPELEVHTLAEILMRIRATDDYGLSRSGIVFQINNGEEHTLLEQDFTAAAEATEELESGDPLSQRTRATLEKLLPLEYFALTEKDSVMYYAFAEDNDPEAPHRAESDWRFVDIRPFRMQFRAPQMGDGNNNNNNGGRRPLTSLEELIRRERYTLNRTVKLDRTNADWHDKEISTIERLIDYQAEIASLTRELAERLAELQQLSEEVDVLFQAESSMLGAIDTLQVGNFPAAVLQEKDAHQYLVEARNRLIIQLSNNPQLRRALSQFNQRMQQKLRQQRSQQLAAVIVQRLKQLAMNQQQTSMQAMMLANAGNGGGQPNAEQPPQSPAAGDPMPENPDAPMPDAPMPTDAQGIDPDDLEERQYAAAADAKDLLDRIDEMPALTDLVRQRLEAAANQTDEAATALSQGELQRAGDHTSQTAEQFSELARQVEALVAPEISDRIAASRNIASRLAQDERELTDAMQPPPGGGDAASEMAREEAMRLAGRVREGAKTLEDVLKSLAGTADRDAGDAPERVADIIENQQLEDTVRRATAAAEAVTPEMPDLPAERRADLEDTAERFELTSADLDRLYRSMVMPRMARLHELERQLSETQREMEPRQDQREIQDFNQELAELIRDMQQAQAAGAAREELFEMVEQERLPGFGDWLEEPNVGRSAPDNLKRLVAQTAEELRRQIHELILADLHADLDSPIPPEYERLVNEYLKVLAADSEQF